MSFKKLHRDESQEWPDTRRHVGVGAAKARKAARGKRLHFIYALPGWGIKRVACHLRAGPGEFTEDPERVTCDFCLGKKEYKKVLFAKQVSQECTCGHRRGQHLQKDGLGRCINCVECKGFTWKERTTECVTV